jgi:hypothetical protein
MRQWGRGGRRLIGRRTGVVALAPILVLVLLPSCRDNEDGATQVESGSGGATTSASAASAPSPPRGEETARTTGTAATSTPRPVTTATPTPSSTRPTSRMASPCQAGAPPSSGGAEVTSLSATAVLYAIRVGDQVEVQELDMSGGTPRLVFAYDAPEFGRGWDVALSNDGRRVAYVGRSALRVREHDSGDERVLVSWVDPPPGEERPPRWSIPEWNDDAEGVFHLSKPDWSHDGRYVSFFMHGHESRTIGMIEIASGRSHRFRDQDWGDLRWGAAVTRVAVTGPSYADRGGSIWVSAKGDPTSLHKMDATVGAPERSYRAAEISPSGDWLAVLFAATPDDFSTERLSLVDLDDNTACLIDGDGDKVSVAIAPDGASAYYVERRGNTVMLVRSSVPPGTVDDVGHLPGGFPTWTDPLWTTSGHLALIARPTTEGPTWCKDCDGKLPRRQKLFILAPDDGRVVYEMADSITFDRVLGFSDR